MLTDDDKTWMSAELERLASRARSGMVSIETNLLSEFHKLQERSEVRFQGIEANMRVSHVRLDDLEERVRKLEQK